jgi:hypothetical protein
MINLWFNSDKHFDTSTPRDIEHPRSHETNVDFHIAKWRFSSYIGRVVDDAFSVSPPSLAVVNRLDEELRQFDRALSPTLKCPNTPPICQGPSWCDLGQVERKTGSDGSIDLQLTMQQVPILINLNCHKTRKAHSGLDSW